MRAGHERYGHRHVGNRSPLPVVVIVCDDSKTAPAYFDVLKRDVKQHLTLVVVPAKCQEASPITVMNRASREYERLRVDQEQDEDNLDAVWALFDLEREAHCRSQAEDARRRAETNNVRSVVSDPCYEVWTLLHLENTGTAFRDCKQVIQRIGQLWKEQFGEAFERKAQADYSKIMPFRRDAAARAKHHWEAGDQSRTEVYKIIEYVDSIVRQSEKQGSTS